MKSFADLGLPHPLVRALNAEGITRPFPIQEAAIPDALAGRDVLGRGPTGSGKTFTFGLPMLARLSGAPSQPGRPRGLVLAPTRELASQIQQRLNSPASTQGLRVLDVVGGVNINTQIRALAAPVDLLVATPGRAEDLLQRGVLDFRALEIVTLDEADQMADMGFMPQVIKLVDRAPKDSQKLLFSATLDGDVQRIVDRYMHNPVTHSTAPAKSAVKTMKHFVLLCGSRESRNARVLEIAAREGKTIMFMRTKHGVDRQVKKLRRAGVHAQGIHGDKGQGARTRALEGFADGSTPVLVATDIAARGIDVSGVSLVVHIDPPAEHKAYLHRAGRTARAGTEGNVVTLVMDEQRKEVRSLLNKAGVRATEVRAQELTPEVVEITGARQPSGKPLPPPGGQPPHQRKNHNATRRSKRPSANAQRRRSTGRSGRRRTPRS